MKSALVAGIVVPLVLSAAPGCSSSGRAESSGRENQGAQGTAEAVKGAAEGVAGTAAAIKRDYQRLSGEWQLTSAVVNGAAVPQQEVKQTILITDGDTFRFPQSSGVGTHPAGTFTINPAVVPHQVDSTAIGGPNAGQKTLGIYEIIDAQYKRACWGPPGGSRPTEFQSPPGSRRILQYWRKIGSVPSPTSR